MCLIAPTRSPSATYRAMSCTMSVVLPAPEKPVIAATFTSDLLPVLPPDSESSVVCSFSTPCEASRRSLFLLVALSVPALAQDAPGTLLIVRWSRSATPSRGRRARHVPFRQPGRRRARRRRLLSAGVVHAGRQGDPQLPLSRDPPSGGNTITAVQTLRGGRAEIEVRLMHDRRRQGPPVIIFKAAEKFTVDEDRQTVRGERR